VKFEMPRCPIYSVRPGNMRTRAKPTNISDLLSIGATLGTSQLSTRGGFCLAE
jgi:hypothetical protein